MFPGPHLHISSRYVGWILLHLEVSNKRLTDLVQFVRQFFFYVIDIRLLVSVCCEAVLKIK